MVLKCVLYNGLAIYFKKRQSLFLSLNLTYIRKCKYKCAHILLKASSLHNVLHSVTFSIWLNPFTHDSSEVLMFSILPLPPPSSSKEREEVTPGSPEPLSDLMKATVCAVPFWVACAGISCWIIPLQAHYQKNVSCGEEPRHLKRQAEVRCLGKLMSLCLFKRKNVFWLGLAGWNWVTCH